MIYLYIGIGVLGTINILLLGCVRYLYGGRSDAKRQYKFLDKAHTHLKTKYAKTVELMTAGYTMTRESYRNSSYHQLDDITYKKERFYTQELEEAHERMQLETKMKKYKLEGNVEQIMEAPEVVTGKWMDTDEGRVL